jgi:2,5-dioxopentanoate dehydrogenase
MSSLTGRSIIGFREGKASGDLFYASNPATGEQLPDGFATASAKEIDLAACLAAEAFVSYGRTSGKQRATFLRKIAERLEDIASEVIERAGLETTLPQARLQGEMARTCGQLRLFATAVEEGSWVGARIDRADPARKPLPKPDVRSLLRPLGPVVVFGASNFPLAFSVAGGDTASALAAGNPVIVKAHPAHPGTSELVGRVVQESVRECGLPEGVFSLLFDAGTQVGIALVKHPMVKAGGFTGSLAGGRALMDVAAARPEPIPFYAEMGSTNPVFVLTGALHERGEAIAAGLHGSFTLGAGQFCTKPGMTFLTEGVEDTAFRNKLQELVEAPAEYKLLTAGIRSAYQAAIAERKKGSVAAVAEAPAPAVTSNGFAVGAALFETDAASFLKNSALESEIFGPTTLLVRNAKRDELLEIARNLEGHLTATIHGTDDDLREFAELIAILEGKVGRLVFNGFPTGVEVTHAMVHGGPYPATSDGRTTSVGSMAIFRFARAVCYQGFPDHALPDELKDANPLGIWRMVDGKMMR